jgi:hypothetical protein
MKRSEGSETNENREHENVWRRSGSRQNSISWRKGSKPRGKVNKKFKRKRKLKLNAHY